MALARSVRERRRLRVLVRDVDARETAGRLDEETEHACVAFPGSKVLWVVAGGVGEDLGTALKQETCDILVSKLTRKGKRVEVLVRRCRRLKAHALVDERLHDHDAAVRDRVNDWAVAVQVGDGGVRAGREEEATHFGVAVDRGVVERVAAINVGLGDGNLLREADLNQREAAGARGLVQTGPPVDVVDKGKVEQRGRDRAVVAGGEGGRRVRRRVLEHRPPEDAGNGRARLLRDSSVGGGDKCLEELVDRSLIARFDRLDERILEVLQRFGRIRLLDVHRPLALRPAKALDALPIRKRLGTASLPLAAQKVLER